MEWVNSLNRTITYMEDHLTEEIDYEALARLACCSSYHYQRMFAYMAGVVSWGVHPAAADVPGGGGPPGRGEGAGHSPAVRLSVAHGLQPGVSGGPRRPALGGAGARRLREELSASALYCHD